MKKSKLPKTDSIQKLAEFWDTHDLTDFEDELEEVAESVFVQTIALGEENRTPRVAADIQSGDNAREVEPLAGIKEHIREMAMIDTTTRQPLYVSTDGGAGPYVMVPVAQLDKIKALLECNKVTFWVDAEAISLDGKPEVTVINLRHGTNPAMVQSLLDSIS